MNTLTRSQAIEELRRQLLKLVDEKSSLCLVAARRGLFCNGFERWSDEELAQRLPRDRHGPGQEKESRAELMLQVNRWTLGLQDIRSGKLPCDVEADGHCSSLFCAGWDQFSDAQLAQFHREMCGEDIEIVPEAAPR